MKEQPLIMLEELKAVFAAPAVAATTDVPTPGMRAFAALKLYP